MKSMTFSFLIVLLCIIAVACGSEVKLPVRNLAEHAEKTLEVKLPVQLKLDCESCDLEIYCWKRQEVKFEYTSSVTGRYTSEELAEKLEHFSFEAQSINDMVVFKSEYKEKNADEGKIRLRIYIPQRTKNTELLCKKGKIRIFDNLEGELFVRGDTLDVDINRFDGKMNCSIKEGNIRLSDGILLDGSSIETSQGNIHVKAEYEISGTYCFIASEGMLDIFLPKNLNAVFTDDVPVEYADFEYSYGDNMAEIQSANISEQNIASFRLESGIEQIHINRF